MRTICSLRSLVASIGLSAMAAAPGFADPGGTGAATPGGWIQLRLGEVDQWVRLDANAQPTGQVQAIGVSSGCTLSPTVVPVTGLMSLSAGAGKPGFFGDSIGTKSGGSTGVPCSRVSDTEVLTLTMGPSLSSSKVVNTRLDVEVKGNARILAKTYFAGLPVACFELQTGTGIGAAPASCGAGFPATVASTCSAQSDSGPDAGPADNCDWGFTATYDKLQLSAVQGAFSLEGGSDYGAQGAPAHYSQFELLSAEGLLDCGLVNNSASENAFDTNTNVTRVGTCAAPVLYSLIHRIVNGATEEKYVDFLTSTNDPAQQFSLTIAWKPEPATSIASIPATFYTVPGDPTEILLDFCTGTPVPDPDTGLTIIVGHNQPTPYACVVSQTVDYLGPFPAPTDPELMEVHQTIYLEGDPTFGRK